MDGTEISLTVLIPADGKRRHAYPQAPENIPRAVWLSARFRTRNILKKASFPLELTLGWDTEKPVILFKNNGDGCDFDWS